MTSLSTPMERISSFNTLASDFCRYLDEEVLDFAGLLERIEVLVVAAEELPDVEPSSDQYDDPPDLAEHHRDDVVVRIGKSFGSACWYEIPRDGADLLIGDLRDDLVDIYSDLRTGLLIADRNLIDAAWELRFSFETHWGEHASSAICALRQGLSEGGRHGQ